MTLQQLVVPKWMADPAILERTIKVYSAYLDRRKLIDISDEFKISVAQIYIDIEHARQWQRQQFSSDLENIIMEQVEARRGVIRELRDTLDRARDGRNSSKRTVAEARILQLISEEERRIEEILGLRNRAGHPLPNKFEVPEDGDVIIITDGDPDE